MSLTNDPTERKRIERLRDKYQAKADAYWHDYQIDGNASAMRTAERNEGLADALTIALNAADTIDKHARLRARVTELDADSDHLKDEVKGLQRLVSDGTL